jgi:hypothetical protein
MLVDSYWFRTNATSNELRRAVTSIGPAEGPFDSNPGVGHRLGFPFSDARSSEWEDASSTGTSYCTLVELRRVPSADERTDRIVGVVGARVALVSTVAEQVGSTLDREGLGWGPLNLPPGALLGDDALNVGLEPISVRLGDQGASTLLKADGWAALRGALTDARGEVVGVTLRAQGGQILSVLPGGYIVFDEPTQAAVVDALSAIETASLAPAW